ncbi:MAG: TIR domain-containing protein [Pseudomonadota bacterium]
MSEVDRRTKVFISYSRKDSLFAERLRDALLERGLDAFLDKNDIAPGEPWRERLNALIVAADVVIFGVSPHSIESSICDWEVNEAERLGKRVLPVVARQTDPETVPGRLNRLNFLFLIEESQWRSELPKLQAAIEIDIDWLRESTRLVDLAERWANANHADRRLLRGSDIDSAEQWLLNHPPSAPEIGATVAEFVAVSRHTARKRQRFVVLGSVGVAAIAFVLAVAALWQRHVAEQERDQALIAQSRYLSDQAQVLTQSGDAGTAALLALAALPNGDAECPMQRPLVPEASLALYSAIHSSREIATLVHDSVAPGPAMGTPSVTGMVRQGRPVYHGQFSPDGKHLLTISADGTARLHSARGDRERTLLSAERSSFPFHGDFSPNGKQIVIGDVAGGLFVFDAATGAKMLDRKAHESTVQRVRFSSDGKLIVSSSSDHKVKVWRLTGNRLELVRTVDRHSDPVYEVAFSHDGRRAISASRDSRAFITIIATGRVIELKGHGPGAVFHAEFSPDGILAATASEDGKVRLWNSASGKLLAKLEGHRAGVSHVEFSPNGHLLVTAARDGDARLWRIDNQTSTRLIGILRGHNDRVYHAAFSPDGTRVVTVSGDHSARIWRVPDGWVGEDRLIQSAEVVLRGHRNWVYHAQFDSTGELVVTTSEDGTARVWSVSGGKTVRQHARHQAHVIGLTLDRDGRQLVSVGSDGRPYITDLKTAAGTWLDAASGNSGATALDVSDNAGLVALATDDGKIAIWDGYQKKLLWRAAVHDDLVTSVRFVDSGRRLLSTSIDGTTHLLESASGRATRTFADHAGWVMGSTIEPSANRIATWSLDGTVRMARLDDASSALTVVDACAGAVTAASFNHRGDVLITACIDGEVGVWNVASGKEITRRKVDLPRAARSLAISPDDRLVAVGSDDGRVRLFEVPAYKEVGTLIGSHSELTDVRFSGDGSYLAVASQDGTVRIWRRSDRSLHALISDYTSGVDSVRFTSGSRELLASSNKLVTGHVFFDRVDELVAYAQRVVVTRKLESTDRKKYGLAAAGQCR